MWFKSWIRYHKKNTKSYVYQSCWRCYRLPHQGWSSSAAGFEVLPTLQVSEFKVHKSLSPLQNLEIYLNQCHEMDKNYLVHCRDIMNCSLQNIGRIGNVAHHFWLHDSLVKLRSKTAWSWIHSVESKMSVLWKHHLQTRISIKQMISRTASREMYNDKRIGQVDLLVWIESAQCQSQALGWQLLVSLTRTASLKLY